MIILFLHRHITHFICYLHYLSILGGSKPAPLYGNADSCQASRYGTGGFNGRHAHAAVGLTALFTNAETRPLQIVLHIPQASPWRTQAGLNGRAHFLRRFALEPGATVADSV